MTVGEVRSVSSGGVAFEGGAEWEVLGGGPPIRQRRYPIYRPTAGASRKVDAQTVVVWGLCAAIFAYKIFFARV